MMAMTIISLADMQRDPGEVLRRVERGETVRIVRGSVAFAEITPVLNAALAGASTPNGNHDRPFGLCAGEFTVPTDFDAPLPESTLREFEG